MQISIIERARAYLARMPVSVQGQGGHGAAFAAAVALVRGFNLGEQDALALLMEWNAGCLPRWTEPDLRHKLRSAAGSSGKTAGYLLNDCAPSRDRTAPDFENEAEKKARQRKAWPTFTAPALADIETISKLRSIPGSALRTAADAGLLKVCRYEQAECFILTDGTFSQARRLNGLPLPIRDGVSKAKSLPGSSGAFIGSSLLDDSSKVLLVEGCIGLLEALGCIALADAQGWTAIAAISAGSRFHRAPELLAKLKGRRVVVVPDNDPKRTGEDAAGEWITELENAGANVDAIKLPPECKDLGPIVSDHLSYEPFLNSLFQ
jgi:hypothetical protein